MRRVSLAARRARQFLRRPPRPRWFRPALYAAGGGLGVLLGGGFGIWATHVGLVAAAEQAPLPASTPAVITVASLGTSGKNASIIATAKMIP